MPYGDGTGPFGEGPRTGRQMGNCPGAAGRRGQGAFGCRRRYLRGGYGGGGFYATLSKDEQIKILEDELSLLEEKKKRIEQRLKELKG